MNAIPFPLLAGYLTGQFDLAERVLANAPSPEQLLDLLLLADQLDAGGDSHSPPPPGDWDGLRQKAGIALMQCLAGSQDAATHQAWRDSDANWQPKMFRHALKSIPGLTDGDLVTLFIQSSETAYLNESRPMQARWDTVSAASRVEILRRIGAPKLVPGPAVNSDIEDRDAAEDISSDAKVSGREDKAPDYEFVSVREALRVAEEAFRPGISDEMLLDLYLLVTECGLPDHAKVFNEIKQAVGEEVERRMKAGAPDPDLCRHVPTFDYPEQNKRSLKALLKDKLPHKNLLLLYEYTWDAVEGDVELAIADLSRGQVLRRMSPPTPENSTWDPWNDRTRTELVRRVLSHDRPSNVQRGGVS